MVYALTAPLPPLISIPPQIACLADYERLAEAHVEAASWSHIQSGEGLERSLRMNREQFDRYNLVPRRLVDLSRASTAIELFGLNHPAPILLAPLAYHRLVHPQAEQATVGAATAMGTTMVASTLSSVTLETIAAQARASATEADTPLPPLWFQLYSQPDPLATRALVRRAEAAGYQVLVWTVDAPVKRAGFVLPDGVNAANLRDAAPRHHSRADGRTLFGSELLADAPTWDMLNQLRTMTCLPIVVKGLLSAADAQLAVKAGAAGIVVSNHGGRVLDGLASPLAVLSGIAAAVADAVPLLLDGGVRTGSDVLKALALGADAVLVGRPQLHALAMAGPAGVAHMLHLLRAELELAMAATGCATPREAGPELLLPA